MDLIINNIEINKKYKWRELCKILEIPYSSGNTRMKYLKEMTSLCEWRKEGCYYIIENIYEEQLKIEDKRKGRCVRRRKNGKYSHLNKDLTNEERCGGFNGYYVYAHYVGEEIVYIGKGSRDRINSKVSRKYDLCKLTKGVILKRFNNEIDALAYEKEMIEYYQSVGQCKYNSEVYHVGKKQPSKEENFNEKINKDIEKMFKWMI